MADLKWDVFISHASEDKATVAMPLAEMLRQAGARVWLDAHELRIGDSLSAKIDEGLSRSRFGAVILSPAFLEKHWPKKEFAGLRAKEEGSGKVILPIWHGVDRATVLRFSPTLADSLAANTSAGLEQVARALLDVIFNAGSDSPSAQRPSVSLRLIRLLESDPGSADIAAFLDYHFRDIYLGFGGPLAFKPIRVGEFDFDAHIKYVGHGLSLRLFRFGPTGDPFDDGPSAQVALAGPMRTIISEIEALRESFASTRETVREVHTLLLDGADDRWRAMARDWTPELSFVVFAARRSFIDRTPERTQYWGELRKLPQITLRSYDVLLDRLRNVPDAEEEGRGSR